MMTLRSKKKHPDDTSENELQQHLSKKTKTEHLHDDKDPEKESDNDSP
jgi:hypothetical protein